MHKNGFVSIGEGRKDYLEDLVCVAKKNIISFAKHINRNGPTHSWAQCFYFYFWVVAGRGGHSLEHM